MNIIKCTLLCDNNYFISDYKLFLHYFQVTVYLLKHTKNEFQSACKIVVQTIKFRPKFNKHFVF